MFYFISFPFKAEHSVYFSMPPHGKGWETLV